MKREKQYVCCGPPPCTCSPCSPSSSPSPHPPCTLPWWSAVSLTSPLSLGPGISTHNPPCEQLSQAMCRYLACRHVVGVVVMLSDCLQGWRTVIRGMLRPFVFPVTDVSSTGDCNLQVCIPCHPCALLHPLALIHCP
jgi:hypothetical protein